MSQESEIYPGRGIALAFKTLPPKQLTCKKCTNSLLAPHLHGCRTAALAIRHNAVAVVAGGRGGGRGWRWHGSERAAPPALPARSIGGKVRVLKEIAGVRGGGGAGAAAGVGKIGRLGALRRGGRQKRKRSGEREEEGNERWDKKRRRQGKSI